MSSANKMITVIQTIREKANTGFTTDDIRNIRSITENMMRVPDALMGVLSIGRVCPQGVDTEHLMEACRRSNPLLLDELVTYPGIDASRLQEAILESLSMKQSIERLQLWYPQPIELPLFLQRTVGSRVYTQVVSEILDGPMHKRELSEETGKLLDKTMGWIGTRLKNDQAVFLLLRAAHYVLRGMSRGTELHHQLEHTFVDNVFHTAWEHYNTSRSEQALVNAVALTVSNRDLFPQALTLLALQQPDAHQLLAPIWSSGSKDITKFINSLKKDAGMAKTVVNRGHPDEEPTI